MSPLLSSFNSTFGVLTGSSNIVKNGLVLHLDAGQSSSYPGSGTTWTDLSGNGNNGTLTNGPTYSSANGGSIVFDGVDDYISGSTISPLPSGSSPRTIEVICKPDINNTPQSIFSYGIDTTAQRVNITNTSSEISLAFSGHRYGKGGLSLQQNFNHIAFVYPINSTSSSSWLMYLNSAELTGLQTLAGSPITMNTAPVQIFYIGSNFGIDLFYNQNIASIKIYNRALTAAEIQQNFNALRGRFGI